MKFKFFSFLLFFINFFNAGAQDFRWQADLEKVKTNGFYKIVVTPQITSKTENTNLSDIRIFEKDKEIAYLIRKTPDSIYIKDSTALKLQNYTLVPAPYIIVKEDKANKRTIIQINFKENYQIDKLVLTLHGFKYYRRTAWITGINPLKRDKKSRYSENRLENFIISSEKQPIIELYGENRYKQLFIIIDNEDSQPLSVKNIKAYQKSIELITYLENNKHYIIKTGQVNISFPRYDLSYFNDSISNSIPFINVLNFKNNIEESPKKGSILITKTWMWLTIAVLIIFLGYLSYYMIKDMQRKKQNH
ncbi:hypothetical protein ABDJ41_15125 [Pedobacter sp. ASV1-7]|uniref:hypothetical protein n=1 Tax=Pedobacter sp. ASV1-7 TaxID=3145237 RepID=UPI0032E90A9D